MEASHVLAALAAILLLLALSRRRGASAPAAAPVFDPVDLTSTLAAGHIDEAELRLRERLTADQGATALDRLQLAQLLILRGAYTEATALLGGGEDTGWWRAVSRFVRAEALVLQEHANEGLLEEVLVRRDQALTDAPAEARIGFMAAWDGLRGLCLSRLSRDDEAVDRLVTGLRDSLQHAPTRAVYVFHLARSLHRLAKFDPARLRYMEVARTAPGSPWAEGAAVRLSELDDFDPEG